VPRPAAGCAVHVHQLGWALGESEEAEGALRVLVAPPSPGASEAALNELLRTLRGQEIPCASSEGANPLDYARAWRYSHVVWLTTASRARVSRLAPEGEQVLGEFELAEVPARLLGG